MIKKDFKICPVTKFIAWLILGLIVCVIGISNVFALSTTTSYANYSNGSLSNSGKYNYGYLSGGVQNFTTANIGSTISGVSYGFMFYYSQNISLGNTYTLVINFHDSDLLASVTSNWVNISTCNSSTCNENTLISMVKSNPTSYSNKVTFKFNPVSVGSVIRFEMGGDNNQPLTGVSNFGISSIQIDSENPSQDIINNNTNNTNNIINNNNSNTQDIINNNNSNAEDTQNTIINNNNDSIINNSLNSCGNQIKFTLKKGKQFTTNGGLQDNSDYYYTNDYTAIGNTNKITFVNTGMVGNDNAGIILVYDSSKNLIDWWSIKDRTIDLPSGSTYFRLSTKITNILLYQGSGCTNKLDKLTDTLTDDSSATFDSSMINLIPNAPITNLLTIPISLLQSILTRANNTCSPISIPFLFNHNISFPCFTLSDYLGSVANTIDLCICFVMIYNIFMLFVSVFEDITTLRDGFLGLYEPQHAYSGYKPKHGKG